MKEDDIFLMLEAVNGMSTGVDPDSDEVDAAWLDCKRNVYWCRSKSMFFFRVKTVNKISNGVDHIKLSLFL